MKILQGTSLEKNEHMWYATPLLHLPLRLEAHFSFTVEAVIVKLKINYLEQKVYLLTITLWVNLLKKILCNK